MIAMNTTMPRLLRILLLTLALGVPLRASGDPLGLFAPGIPYAWSVSPDPVAVWTDLGTLGFLTNVEADVLAALAVGEWSSVPSSSFVASVLGDFSAIPAEFGGPLPDITGANCETVIGVFNGGGLHIIYDTDGSVLTDCFGVDPEDVLGVATFEFAVTDTPEIVEGYAVIGGTGIDPSDTMPFPGAIYAGVFSHEFGHAINLAHTQVNGNVFFFEAAIGPVDKTGIFPVPCSTPYAGTPGPMDIETMYPFIDVTGASTTGLGQSSVDHPSDMAALSDIYPAPGWPAGVGTITGVVIGVGGVLLSGVNVIARNISDPFLDAFSAISGHFSFTPRGGDPDALNGVFTLNGLMPGATYVLYINGLVEGSFSTPPADFLASEEYWNGMLESDDPTTDMVCMDVPIIPTPGAPFAADILLNTASLPVELTTFEARTAGTTVLLNWTTASETANAGFEVQHQEADLDAASWHPLAFVEGHGTTTEARHYTYQKTDLSPGLHRLRLKQIDYDGAFTYSPVVEVTVAVPGAYLLSEAYPNPFNPQAHLTLSVARRQSVRIVVYNPLGQAVSVLHEGPVEPGIAHPIRFEAGTLPSGTYYLRATGETFSATRTLLLVK